MRLHAPVVRPFMKSPEQGAATSIHLASSPELEGVTGRYFANERPKRSSKASYDTGRRRAAVGRLGTARAPHRRPGGLRGLGEVRGNTSQGCGRNRLPPMSPVYDCTTESGRAEGIAGAVEVVRDGGVVVLPTDTVYGIGADAFSPEAVASVLAAKGRGREMPPPVLVPSVRTVDGLATDVPAVGARPHPRVLARAAHPGVQGPVLADVGPRRHQRHGRRAHAEGRHRARPARRGGADGGHQRQPHRPARRRPPSPTPPPSSAPPSPSTSTPARPRAPRCRPSSTAPATSRSCCAPARHPGEQIVDAVAATPAPDAEEPRTDPEALRVAGHRCRPPTSHPARHEPDRDTPDSRTTTAASAPSAPGETR